MTSTYCFIMVLCGLVLIQGTPVHAHYVAARCPATAGWTQLVAPEHTTLPRDLTRAVPELWSVAAGWESADSLYAGGARALYRSDDCGLTWETVYELPSEANGYRPGWYVLTLAVGQNQRVYVGHRSVYGWLEASVDGGKSWQDTYLLGDAVRVIVAPSAPATAYVLGSVSAVGTGRRGRGVVWRSTDDGRTWEPRTVSRPPGSPLVDPGDPSVLYVIGHGRAYRSTDAAASFELVGAYESLTTSDDIGTAHHQTGLAAINIEGSRLWFVSTDGGFFQSKDRGAFWDRLDNVPFESAVRSMSASRLDPHVFFAVVGGDQLWMYRAPRDG